MWCAWKIATDAEMARITDAPPASSHGGEQALVGLGSNLGDRWAFLRQGVEQLSEVMEIRSVSSVWESPAWGGEPQGDYLNAVILGHAELPPRELMKALLAIEADSGRIRTERNAPRTLDLDLLFLGSQVLREDDLTLPHPRWRERSFVVLPLLEVAPGFVDPESGVAIGELFPGGTPVQGARKVGPLAGLALAAALP